ncbi:MAG: aquaporin [Gemmataceae bacterium]
MSWTRKLAAEFLGTYCLVFAGTGAIVVNDVSGGQVTHLGIACCFGLIVFAMIATFGDISGAYLNPAVSTGLLLAGRFSGRWYVPYITVQFLGAIAASLSLHLLFPTHATLGLTTPSGPASQSFILELFLTFMLMATILMTTADPNGNKLYAALAIGAMVGLEALFAGPICGASMNPARSLGPALVSGKMDTLWIYLTATTLGAIIAVPICRFVIESPRKPSVEESK